MVLIYALGKQKISYFYLKTNLFHSRYDTHDHSLSDFPAENYDREVFPGQDYSNPRVKDFVNGNYPFFVTLNDINQFK